MIHNCFVTEHTKNGQEIVVIGGLRLVPGSKTESQVEIFIVANHTWSIDQYLPEPIYQMQTVPIKNTHLIVGATQARQIVGKCTQASMNMTLQIDVGLRGGNI